MDVFIYRLLQQKKNIKLIIAVALDCQIVDYMQDYPTIQILVSVNPCSSNISRSQKEMAQRVFKVYLMQEAIV